MKEKNGMETTYRQKRAAAIHDLSGFGRCSLTVALPILSAAGIETAALPTALLSTHTGGIDGYTYLDLTDEMVPFINHWKSLALDFNAIYSGFLGSIDQIAIVSDFIDQFKKSGTIVLVDPVMADNGELYKVFTGEYVEEMRKLCRKADILVPNLTEAFLLLEKEYLPGPYPEAVIEELLIGLSELGPSRIVLTGVFRNETELGVATFDSKTRITGYTFSGRIPAYYHGTGDVYGSALLAALLNDFSLKESASIAVDFTVQSIERSFRAKTDYRFGVNFEQTIPFLLQDLKLI